MLVFYAPFSMFLSTLRAYRPKIGFPPRRKRVPKTVPFPLRLNSRIQIISTWLPSFFGVALISQRLLAWSTPFRLARSVGLPADLASSGHAVDVPTGFGVRWYRAAAAASPRGAGMLGEVAASFDGARRALTLIADRYLFPSGLSGWDAGPLGG